MENPEMLLSMMKADKKTPDTETSDLYLMADGKKITDPKEISTYVKEKVMPMCGMDSESKETEEPNEDPEMMKREALDGLNLD